ncbi:MAG: ABC transporter ATP-binding protein [Eubacterium sp.]|nr:ABC transporter ATP-binding protein [Eubacterium sp.]
MSKKLEENKGLGFWETVKNNFYALGFVWSMSKSYVIHAFFSNAIGYFIWVFYSAYFIRYIIQAVTGGGAVSTVYFYIGMVSALMCVLILYDRYVDRVVKPLKEVELYQRMYSVFYHKAENVELECFEDTEFYNRYTMAVDQACEKMTKIVWEMTNIICAAIAGISTYVLMYRMDPRMLLFVLSPIVGSFVFGTIMNKLNFAIYREVTPDNRKTEYVNRVMYLGEYAKEMRLSNIFQVLKRTYEEAVAHRIQVVKSYISRLIPSAFLQFYLSYIIIFEGLLLYGAYQTMVVHRLSLADLSILSSMMVTASWILVRIGNSMMTCSQNGMFVYNIRTFMSYEEKIPEDARGDLPDQEIESIEFCHVSFSYRGGKEVIHDLSFKIGKNESVALVGHNGAGKTTILKLLFRLYDPDAGQILVNGRDIREYDLEAYRNLFAAAFQDYKIFAYSVMDNILMERQVEDPEKVTVEALKRAGVYEKVMSLPQGIHTMLTKEFEEEGAVLSGGEYQKIVVARAFANPASVKVFDEPSSALDPIAEYDLFQAILEESRDHIMFFISHRLSSVKDADVVYMLEEGCLIEQGTHEELMGQNGKYARMYRMQAKNYQPEESDLEVEWDAVG